MDRKGGFIVCILFLLCISVVCFLLFSSNFKYHYSKPFSSTSTQSPSYKDYKDCAGRNHTNVDIIMIVTSAELAMASHLLRSLDEFMPCRGTLHIVTETDKENIDARAWFSSTDVVVHLMNKTTAANHIYGYHLQQWVKFWADTYITNPINEFIMYVEPDTIFGLNYYFMTIIYVAFFATYLYQIVVILASVLVHVFQGAPVTCASLFDEHGRPYLGYWDFEPYQPQFKEICDYFTGDCKVSFMAFFPFVLPTASLARLRSHMMSRTSSSDFDSALIKGGVLDLL